MDREVVSLAPIDAPDTDGVWAATLALPEQLEAVSTLVGGVGPLPGSDDISNIVVFGMGGSGIGGDVVAAIGAPELAVPITVVKDYACPAFVGPGTLAFALSYSGDTEETIEAASEAARRGARLVCITSGGQLRDLAADADGRAVVPLPPVPWPRCAFGAVSVSPLLILERLGLLEGVTAAVTEAIAQLRRRRTALVAAGQGNEAAKFAAQIGRTIPLIHGGQALGGAAALRWKCQVNENAKCPAFSSVEPELCHNELVGFGQHGDATRQLMTLVMLRHSYEHPQVAQRFAKVAELLDEVVSQTLEIRAEGDGPLAQLFDLAFVGDIVSLYLAGQERIDPGPIPVLTELKRALATG